MSSAVWSEGQIVVARARAPWFRAPLPAARFPAADSGVADGAPQPEVSEGRAREPVGPRGRLHHRGRPAALEEFGGAGEPIGAPPDVLSHGPVQVLRPLSPNPMGGRHWRLVYDHHSCRRTGRSGATQ